MSETLQVCKRPEEGKWFEVNPNAINQQLFQDHKVPIELGFWEAIGQRDTRNYILEALDMVKDNPGKYGRPFMTMMPEKNWNGLITVAQIEKLASKHGNHNADWVEQALEWAQRIQNGESWEDVCNKPDTANCKRLVLWKNGFPRIVGGSVKDYDYHPASFVSKYSPSSFVRYAYTVPLVVLYSK